jgi:hypothetical protein
MSSISRGAVTRKEVPIARLKYLASRIHRLGPRPLYQLLCELAQGADLVTALERYARLAPLAGFIVTLNGDRLPPPVRLVGGRR